MNSPGLEIREFILFTFQYKRIKIKDTIKLTKEIALIRNVNNVNDQMLTL